MEGALSQFRSAINSQPNYAPARYQLALALKRKGDKAGAAAEVQKAAELDLHFKSPPE